MPTRTQPRLCRYAGREQWHIYDADPTAPKRRFSTGCTEREEAELFLANYKELRSQPAAPPLVSVASILDLYLEDRRKVQIPGWPRLEYAHKPLKRILGTLPPELINPDQCREYARQRVGIAQATIRTELQALRAALRWAAAPDVKLTKEAPRIVMPTRPPSRVRFLMPDEAERLLDGAKAPHLRLFIQIAMRTGARSGAILALTWERVNFGRRLIDFRVPGKQETRKRQVMTPISDTLFAVLLEARQLATTDYVIEWAKAPIARIVRGFRDAAMRAQLRGVTPHTLRHTAVTLMLADGIEPWKVAKFHGMTLEMVQDVYGHMHPDWLRDAAAALDRAFPGPPRIKLVHSAG